MNSFDCYPTVFSKEDNLSKALGDILNNGEIPFKIITDEKDKLFIELAETLPPTFIPHYFILIIKYKENFKE